MPQILELAIQAAAARAHRALKAKKPDLDTGAASLAEAARLAEAAADLRWQGEIALALGALAGLRSDVKQALAHNQGAVDLFRRAGDRRGKTAPSTRSAGTTICCGSTMPRQSQQR